MLFLYAPLGRWLLAANDLTVPWQTIVLSVLIYVGLPLLAVPVMLMLIKLCKRTAFGFPRQPEKASLPDPRCIISFD